ncbi:heavy metal-binding domain-containing protein [Geomonas oryzae]|uniref:heavy metal-binding domain-containing protein n=1 Tax=Geomonas oryzae TaxID=2364273 RepID=UPI00100BFEE2|nr:heavy metal-binding domain-containing protein [Geomonas oryzae]
MDTAPIIVTLGGIALIAFTLWFFFGKKSATQPSSPKGALYACPMHPWITSSDPTADCSICGMKLVKSDEVGK